jgi:hypothetical protein
MKAPRQHENRRKEKRREEKPPCTALGRKWTKKGDEIEP